MDWLKDKKNQPIIAIAAAVVIVGVLVFVLRPMIFGGGSSSDTGGETPAADTSGMQPPQDPNTMPPSTPGMPAAAPTGATPSQQGTQTAQASSGPTPMEKWRSDPFLPVGYKPPKKHAVRKLPIVDFPFPRIPIPRNEDEIVQIQDVVQPVRRMAGLLLNNRVYAIIETNGVTEIVQPGDKLKDQLAVVEKIEQDKVILKTTGKKPRYIVVRMASSPKVAEASTQTAVPTGAAANDPMLDRTRRRPPMPGM
jgi:hypothetical protein